MDNPVTLTYKFSKGEMLTSSRLSMRHSAQYRKIQRNTFWWGSIAISLPVINIIARGFRRDNVVFLCVFVCLGMVVLATPLFTRRYLSKMYARRPDKDSEVHWEIAADRFVVKTEGSFSEMSWTKICRVIKTREGFLMYPNEQLQYWLPSHAFGSADDIERLAQLARSKVQNYEDAA